MSAEFQPLENRLRRARLAAPPPALRGRALAGAAPPARAGRATAWAAAAVIALCAAVNLWISNGAPAHPAPRSAIVVARAASGAGDPLQARIESHERRARRLAALRQPPTAEASAWLSQREARNGS
jgi:hypothetical protein